MRMAWHHSHRKCTLCIHILLSLHDRHSFPHACIIVSTSHSGWHANPMETAEISIRTAGKRIRWTDCVLEQHDQKSKSQCLFPTHIIPFCFFMYMLLLVILVQRQNYNHTYNKKKYNSMLSNWRPNCKSFEHTVSPFKYMVFKKIIWHRNSL